MHLHTPSKDLGYTGADTDGRIIYGTLATKLHMMSAGSSLINPLMNQLAFPRLPEKAISKGSSIGSHR